MFDDIWNLLLLLKFFDLENFNDTCAHCNFIFHFNYKNESYYYPITVYNLISFIFDTVVYLETLNKRNCEICEICCSYTGVNKNGIEKKNGIQINVNDKKIHNITKKKELLTPYYTFFNYIMKIYHQENIEENIEENNTKYKFYENTIKHETKFKHFLCNYESVQNFLEHKTIPKIIIKIINEQSLLIFDELTKNIDENKIHELEYNESLTQLEKLNAEQDLNNDFLLKLKQELKNNTDKTYNTIKTYNENIKKTIQTIENLKNNINLQNNKIIEYEKKFNQNKYTKQYLYLLNLIINKSKEILDNN